MKKTLFFLITFFLIILAILVALFMGIQSENKLLRNVNGDYEFYFNKPIYGTELVSLINKAVDNNIQRNVAKNERGFFIDNGKDSILITVQLLDTDEKFEMERIAEIRNRAVQRII